MGCSQSASGNNHEGPAKQRPSPAIDVLEGTHAADSLKGGGGDVPCPTVMAAANGGAERRDSVDSTEAEEREYAKMQGMSMAQVVEYFRDRHQEQIPCRAAAHACMDFIATEEGLAQLSEYEVASFLPAVVGAQEDSLAKARCTKVLLALVGMPAQRAELQSRGAVAQVVSSMVKCGDVDTLADACRLLRKFAQHHDNAKAKVAANQSISQILEAVHQHSDAPEFLLEAFDALQVMAPLPNSQEIIFQQKGVKKILGAMSRNSSHARVQARGCHVIAGVVYNSPGNRKAFEKQHGPKLVLSAMKLHGEDGDVQMHGLKVVQRNCTSDPVNQDAFANEGGLDIILAAMAKHPEHLQIQEAGYWAIRDFVADNGKNRKLCEDAQVKEKLTSAASGESQDVRRAAAAALEEFEGGPSARASARLSGTGALLARVIRRPSLGAC